MTYVSPNRRSPDSRSGIMNSGSFSNMPKHQSFVPKYHHNQSNILGSGQKLPEMERRMTYNYKDPMVRISTENNKFGGQAPSGFGEFRSPSKQGMYYRPNEESMEEIQMTEAGGEPGQHSFSQDDNFSAMLGPSVASSIFVNETMGPGMKAQKSAFNNNRQIR